VENALAEVQVVYEKSSKTSTNQDENLRVPVKNSKLSN
jgi:hypothetical protein